MVARDHFQVTVVNDKLYAVGGRDSTSNPQQFFDDTEPAVDVFDFRTNTWNTIADFPRPRAGLSSVVYNNTVVSLGGEGHGRAWSEVDVLEDGAFRVDANMLEPRHGMQVVSCEGAMWIAGGDRVQGAGSRAEDTFAYYSGSVPPVCTPRPSPPVEGTAVPPESSATTTVAQPGSPTVTTGAPSEQTPDEAPQENPSGPGTNNSNIDLAPPAPPAPQSPEPPSSKYRHGGFSLNSSGVH